MSMRYIKLHPEMDNFECWKSEMADCYIKVFADEPWNEWKKCPKTGQKWGIKDSVLLEQKNHMHEGVQLVDFWPKENVLEDFAKEITSDSSCWIAYLKETSEVVGFCYGYGISPDDLETKLELVGIADAIRGFQSSNEPVAYQDDMGVVHDQRRKGIASQLFEERLNDFKNMGLKYGVIRTMTNPPSVTNLWYTNRGYEVVGRYHDADERVIMMIKFDDLK